ncbi:MAG: HEAT repeat domain-containing protein [Planctomycetota bacterium]
MSNGCASLAVALSLVLLQDPVDAQIERLLHDARQGSPVIRPQAARRLLKLGQPAAERLVREAGDGTASAAALGTDLIEVLGEFGDARLRELLWRAVQDRDFPWRPAAARSLVVKASAAEADRFQQLSGDALSAVRLAAIEAIDQLDLRDRQARVRELLQDADDRVRRQAARLCDRWGDKTAVAWLLEDLERDDQFFELATGKTARIEATRALEALLGDRLGYDPAKAPDDAANRTAIAALRARAATRAGKPLPVVPAIARAGHATPGDALGLEVRSCRHGEFFLRWTLDDELLVGTGLPLRVALAKGTVARLLANATAAIAELHEQRVYGTPGCDFEQFHVQTDPRAAARVQTVRVMKSPDMKEAIRPAALSRLAAELLDSIPDEPLARAADPRAAGLRAHLRQALTAIGGKLGPQG